MNIFKSYTFKWWQMGIFKLALIGIGILIGSYWAEFWGGLTTPVIVVTVVASAYVLCVAVRGR